ncbi:MAG TPA: hypothetical protein VFV67_22975 [Actinophytocola sp.]|uniref:DUF7144 family membrane protein n=1 Tax=Actinophytocola sp. TaxID=1872138 RepID=UPI002DBC80B9|nr:hypothetical protein [Actinophytocola sp.]HEU5473519.1 hypothetical protein [Actinophytocola sp.]
MPTQAERRTAMVSYDSEQQQGKPVSGWAIGGITFAATIMLMVGVFQAIAGLVALFDDQFYVVGDNYTFKFDITAWGWIHLILGIGLAIAGYGLFTRATWAGIVAMTLAVLSGIANFFFIPYYPIWSLVIIALDVWVIWSLTRPYAIKT